MILSFPHKVISADIEGITFQIGIKGGYGYSDAEIFNHTSTPLGFTTKDSMSGGIHVHFSHVEYVRMQIEALYIKKGFKRNTFWADIDCFSFPILLRLQAPFGLYANFGFSPTYMHDGEVYEKNSTYKDIDNYFERLIYDFQGGIGWDIKVSKSFSFFMELRYSEALNNISNNRYPEGVFPVSTHLFFGVQSDFSFISPPKPSSTKEGDTTSGDQAPPK